MKKHKHVYYRSGFNYAEIWGVGDKTQGIKNQQVLKCECGKTKQEKSKIPVSQLF